MIVIHKRILLNCTENMEKSYVFRTQHNANYIAQYNAMLLVMDQNYFINCILKMIKFARTEA